MTSPTDLADDRAARGTALAAITPLLREHYVFPDVVDAVAAAVDGLGPELAADPEEWAGAVTSVLQSSSGDLHCAARRSSASRPGVAPIRARGCP